jgi:hypothetical protein
MCKLDGTTAHVGEACTVKNPVDPACGTDVNVSCNTEADDGFPGGYCSLEPCTDVLCPVGSSCALLGPAAQDPACWRNCTTNTDCRTNYVCADVDTRYRSGASHKICYLATFGCLTNDDCPSVKPTCVIPDGGVQGTCT